MSTTSIKARCAGLRQGRLPAEARCCRDAWARWPSQGGIKKRGFAEELPRCAAQAGVRSAALRRRGLKHAPESVGFFRQAPQGPGQHARPTFVVSWSSTKIA